MGLILYRILLFLYASGVEIASVFNKKARLWYQGRKSIFKRLSKAFKGNTAPVIWFHCASLGEFEQGRPLLEALRDRHPDHKILLSFFSPSGYEIHKNYTGADWIFYLPLDSHYHAKRWLSITKPKLVVFVKYEFWYFYLKAVHDRKIPLILVSALFRKDQPFFKWYGSLLHIKMLRFYRHIFVQDDNSVRLLESIHIQAVTRTGDTRVDRVLAVRNNWTPIEKIDQFCQSSPVIVAGSTWPEDDNEIRHYAASHPEIRFIIAPHEIHPNRLEDCLELYPGSILYSQYLLQPEAFADRHILIIDNIGKLKRLYHYARICFVGGGFGKDGIHNTLEAAVYEKPVVFGPVYEHFKETVEMEKAGAAFPVDNVLELEQTFNDLLSDQPLYQSASRAAADFIRQSAGATNKILTFIDQNLIP
ncbi:3-deoxy-D-manno-octulosonic-acid transferase [Arachidicoccus rhizosphaerae]|uniref:3-deoxy-D-manno-octulosonic acid transferase n=1 Tax=Arachidicoccus rhizosphaerae TaxID=551991 RepID=A0A1H3YKH1_9BACT|nr:glycosyltransferase N-terminal domain-containing protein [Arachidicoccus rhizosphaerae]SEA11458.1 3-deoxy-D-manno-octulosonic-acid transferase [Arachidicoccus rhizosphaerae]